MRTLLRVAVLMWAPVAAGAQGPLADRVTTEYLAWRESVDVLLPKLAAAGPEDAAAMLADVETRLIRQHNTRRALQKEFLRSFARLSDELAPASQTPAPQALAPEIESMRRAALQVSGQAGLLTGSGGSGAASEQRIASEEMARARDRLGALAAFLSEGATLLERYSAEATSATASPATPVLTPARLFNEVHAEMDSDDQLLERQRATLHLMRRALVAENEKNKSDR